MVQEGSTSVGEGKLHMGRPHGNNRMAGWLDESDRQFEFLKPKTLVNKISTKNDTLKNLPLPGFYNLA